MEIIYMAAGLYRAVVFNIFALGRNNGTFVKNINSFRRFPLRPKGGIQAVNADRGYCQSKANNHNACLLIGGFNVFQRVKHMCCDKSFLMAKLIIKVKL